jgi:hypothetical protein
MHHAVDDLVDDEAPVEVALRKRGIGRTLDQRRDICLLGDEALSCFMSNMPKIGPLKGWRTSVMI